MPAWPPLARRAAGDRHRREGRLGTFSGGNQPKGVLARTLAQAPDVILADEPTWGVDIGARVEIHAA